jgi:hypothetical protein
MVSWTLSHGGGKMSVGGNRAQNTRTILVMVVAGWICSSIVSIYLAAMGRLPSLVPIIRVPVFAFLLWGIVAAWPNPK